ncbi:beta-lactamase family protein [Candidatus Binatia bacterium]|nr:beta-lactamase family protein [Candidatus Binatia bacterium]
MLPRPRRRWRSRSRRASCGCVRIVDSSHAWSPHGSRCRDSELRHTRRSCERCTTENARLAWPGVVVHLSHARRSAELKVIKTEKRGSPGRERALVHRPFVISRSGPDRYLVERMRRRAEVDGVRARRRARFTCSMRRTKGQADGNPGRAVPMVARALVVALLLASCGPTSSQPTYDAAIDEGRTAANDLLQHGASAVAIALVQRDRVVWTETFGVADREAGRAPSDDTLFGIGSVSKMRATIAVMKLVDRGVVDLDTPLVKYLPAFRMAADGYEGITVRMLLNHSSGFPGTDYRNADIRTPAPAYLDQVLQTLSTSRLKAPPGAMSVYCNDGFTVVGALVEALTGQSYVAFVEDEILEPLGMTSTRYPLAPFPDGTYAKAYADGVARPQEFVNTLAAGGAYSTAGDLARIAMLFLGDGAVGKTRILSHAAVAAMAQDQTIGSFDPVRNESFAFGLGWDTVAQPGLASVGFDGWAKAATATTTERRSSCLRRRSSAWWCSRSPAAARRGRSPSRSACCCARSQRAVESRSSRRLFRRPCRPWRRCRTASSRRSKGSTRREAPSSSSARSRTARCPPGCFPTPAGCRRGFRCSCATTDGSRAIRIPCAPSRSSMRASSASRRSTS